MPAEWISFAARCQKWMPCWLRGKVRCLGVMADQRIAGFEHVATFKEQRHEWSIAGWRGLAAPVGIPEERLERLEAAIASVANSDELRDFMSQAGFNLSLEAPVQFEQTLSQQDRIFEKVLTGPAFTSIKGEQYGPMLFPMVILILLDGLLAVSYLGIFCRQTAGSIRENGVVQAVWCHCALCVLLACVGDRWLFAWCNLLDCRDRFDGLASQSSH